VIQSFADEPTADLFRERNTKAARSVPHELWPVVRRKLKMLDVASQLEDLLVPPGNRLERLRGKLADRFSIRVNSQYRVTFQWKKGDAYEVRVEDYH
jgi:proteic killer suppression protein